MDLLHHVNLKANFDDLVKSRKRVIPAKAGIHKVLKLLDSRLRGNDINKRNWTFYEAVNFFQHDYFYFVTLRRKQFEMYIFWKLHRSNKFMRLDFNVTK